MNSSHKIAKPSSSSPGRRGDAKALGGPGRESLGCSCWCRQRGRSRPGIPRPSPWRQAAPLLRASAEAQEQALLRERSPAPRPPAPLDWLDYHSPADAQVQLVYGDVGGSHLQIMCACACVCVCGGGGSPRVQAGQRPLCGEGFPMPCVQVILCLGRMLPSAGATAAAWAGCCRVQAQQPLPEQDVAECRRSSPASRAWQHAAAGVLAGATHTGSDVVADGEARRGHVAQKGGTRAVGVQGAQGAGGGQGQADGLAGGEACSVAGAGGFCGGGGAGARAGGGGHVGRAWAVGQT